MRNFWLLASLLTVFFSPSLWALDKEAMKDHVRKAFNLDPRMTVTIGDPVPSQFQGLSSFTVTLDQYTQNVFLSSDGRYYIWGNMFDLKVDPDADRASRIDLKGVPIKGPKNAPVTVVVYSDIQCPNCRQAHKLMDTQLFKDFPRQVRHSFKQFPLSSSDWSEAAAVATVCAGWQSEAAFWKMADHLYNKSEGLSASTIRDFSLQTAKELKLNEEKFKLCLDNPLSLETVHAHKHEGMAIGVNATPTFFVNGRMVRGANYEALKGVIEEKLKKK